MALHPVWLDAVVVLINGDVHLVAPIHDLEAAVFHVRLVYREQDGQVLDVFDVSVRNRVNVRRKTAWILSGWEKVWSKTGHLTAPGQLVVDLLLEQEHRFPRKVFEQAEQLHSPQQGIEAVVVVGVVLRSAENPFATGVDLLRWFSGVCVHKKREQGQSRTS